MKAGKIEAGRAAIFNPKKLDPVASVDFCGACHRTWADVILGEQKLRSVMNVRFQPYRLEDSKCWRNSQADPRLACVACHNPHEQLNQDASSYDAKCLTCHTAVTGEAKSAPAQSVVEATLRRHPANSTGGTSETEISRQKSPPKTPAKVCPQSKSNCITCHMPQVEVPSVHATFFDHHIRIVRPNSPYPM